MQFKRAAMLAALVGLGAASPAAVFAQYQSGMVSNDRWGCVQLVSKTNNGNMHHITFRNTCRMMAEVFFTVSNMRVLLLTTAIAITASSVASAQTASENREARAFVLGWLSHSTNARGFSAHAADRPGECFVRVSGINTNWKAVKAEVVNFNVRDVMGTRKDLHDGGELINFECVVPGCIDRSLTFDVEADTSKLSNWSFINSATSADRALRAFNDWQASCGGPTQTPY